MQTDETKNESQPLPLGVVIGGFLPKDDNKNWHEDYEHENGNYLNTCIICKSLFKGYKRRVLCKECSQSTTVIVGAGRIHIPMALAEHLSEVLSIEHPVKEARQLAQIIEDDRERGLIITAKHYTPKKDLKNKKPFWKNGKLRYK